MIGLAIDAFRASVERVEAAPATTALAMYAPLTEAAWWATCVDLAFEKTPGYTSKRNSTATGKTVCGLRYARSALGHHWTFIAQPIGGLKIPYTIPYKIEVVPSWLPVGELPDFEGHQSAIRAHYAARLDGRPVRATLAEADEWFGVAERAFA